MLRYLLLSATVLLGLANTGCFINIYSADKNERMEQLMFQSEDLRQIRGEWRRFWFTDMPSHMTYERVHGGIGPYSY